MGLIPHFIRPYWLGLLLPAVAYLIWLVHHHRHYNPWLNVCDAHLLTALVQAPPKQDKLPFYGALGIFYSLCICALAGPAWHKSTLPVYQESDAVMLVLDLSSAMQESDLKPDRMTRAKYKIRDFINAAKTTQMGLVVFSAEAFTVTPLSADANTLSSLLEELTPAIMPVDGADSGQGLVAGANLLAQAAIKQGNVLLITASAPTANSISAARHIAAQGGHLHVLGMLEDNVSNQALITQLHELAQNGNGTYYPFSTEASALMATLHTTASHQVLQNENANAYLWVDAGPYICLLLLPFGILLLREHTGHEKA